MSKRVLVIGGGVIGLSTAYYSAKRGHQVTVLERLPEQRDGCSFGNAGMVVPSHFVPLAAPGMVALGLKWMLNPESPFYIKPRFDRELWSWCLKFWRAANAKHVRRSAPLLRDLHLASRACFEELAALPDNDFGLVKRGLLMLCKTPHALAEEFRMGEQARELGIPAETLDARQTAALDPNVRMDVIGSVYFPKDCHLSPARFMAGMKKQLDRLGAGFAWETRVTGWRVRGRRIEALQSNHGELKADEYVLCGGAWSPLIGRDLGLRISMQAGKGYNLTLSKPRQLPTICSIFSEARMAATPMDSSLRFAGTMEIAGLNEEINPARVRALIKSVPKYFPDFTAKDFEDVQPWCGLRPCSADGLPYLGRVARFDNFSIATGHAMLGLSLGPVTGKLMSEILSDITPSITIELLNPCRYE